MREQEWRDWSPEQIINPSLRRYSFNHEAMFSFTSIPGSRRIKRMTDIDRWMAFQDVLKEFPRFIHMGQEYTSRRADENQADWVEAIASAAETENMTVGVGTAFQNQFSGGVRVAKPLTVMKLSDNESDIYAEVADNKQLGDTGKHKTLKLLYIHNPGKVAPYRTKSFVRRLREALLGTCGYSLVYAHVADCDQPDNPAQRRQRQTIPYTPRVGSHREQLGALLRHFKLVPLLEYRLRVYGLPVTRRSCRRMRLLHGEGVPGIPLWT